MQIDLRAETISCLVKRTSWSTGGKTVFQMFSLQEITDLKIECFQGIVNNLLMIPDIGCDA